MLRSKPVLTATKALSLLAPVAKALDLGFAALGIAAGY